MLEVFVLRALKDNFVYVLRSGADVAVVDPGEWQVVDKFLRLKQWPLQQIFCTHHHLDHVGGAMELSHRYTATIITSKHDFNRIAGASRPVEDGDIVNVGSASAEVLMIPGHTLGHWALHFSETKCLFVGDTLFSAGCGRLFEGTPAQMFASMQKLKSKMQPGCRIYFGHEYTERNLQFVAEKFPEISVDSYFSEVQAKRQAHKDTTPTTLEQELIVNPFLRAKNVTEFRQIRELRDKF